MNKWKSISAVLLIIIFAETAFIAYGYNLASESIKNKEICMTGICDVSIHTAFFYDSEAKLCSCWIGDNVVYREYVR